MHNEQLKYRSEEYALPLKKIGGKCIDLLKNKTDPEEITDFIISQAIFHKSSDIHVEYDGKIKLCFRINKILTTVSYFNNIRGQQLINSFKLVYATFLKKQKNIYTTKISITRAPWELFDLFIIPFTPFDSIIIRLQTNGTCIKRSIQYTQKIKNIKKPIFVWQMGKVGSTSIFASLKPLSSSCRKRIITLEGNNNFIQYNNIIHTHDIRIMYNFLHNNDEEFIIISLVRDILLRNISSVFQSMCDPSPQNNVFIAHKNDFKKLSYKRQEEEIISKLYFLNNSGHIFNWYNDLFKSHFYYPNINKFFIDIYGKKFNHAKGFQIYESNTPRIKMMIIRLEDLNDLEQEINNFLQIKNFKLIKSNLSSEKWYKPIYKQFLKNYRPDKKVLDKIYNSQFMKYFYSQKEINSFIRRWEKA